MVAAPCARLQLVRGPVRRNGRGWPFNGIVSWQFMRLRYRCPQCKRRLQHLWFDRQDAAGIAIGSMEVVAYIIAFGLAALGYLLEWWELVIAILIVGGTCAWAVYRALLWSGRRYHCSSCDRTFRADYLQAQANAPQVTEIAS